MSNLIKKVFKKLILITKPRSGQRGLLFTRGSERAAINLILISAVYISNSSIIVHSLIKS